MQIRIDKVLSQLQIATRSEAKKMIRQGRVRINDTIVKDGGEKFQEGCDRLFVDGRGIAYETYEYLMLHKPAGCVTATEDGREKTVMDYLPKERHRNLAPVGRLDKDTEGLLLLTDDGELNHNLLAPGKHVEKTYYVRVKGLITAETVQQFLIGLEIGEKKPTAPATLQILKVDAESGESEANITITEGKFHQIKRMFHAVGMEVLYLKRIRMGTLFLDETLEPGQWRPLTEEEIRELRETHI